MHWQTSQDYENAPVGSDGRRARLTLDVPKLNSKVTLSDRIYEVLRGLILKGELAPGKKITESEVASEMGVSITPVREAFLKLAAAGLLVVRPRQAAQVTMLSLSALQQLAMVRAALEEAVLGLIIDRVTEKELQAIREVVDTLEEYLDRRDWDSYAESHRRFHELLLEPARCPIIKSMIMEAFDAGQRYWRQIQAKSIELWERDQRYHEQLFAAIVRRDREAGVQLLRLDHREYPDLVREGVLYERRPFASFFADATGEE